MKKRILMGISALFFGITLLSAAVNSKACDDKNGNKKECCKDKKECKTDKEKCSHDKKHKDSEKCSAEEKKSCKDHCKTEKAAEPKEEKK
ncbi:MAG: hypothetical protein L6Q78_01915 [Bacteroidia bacterium]|nr:hypothetical protein [Bacteroidia bacterium]